MNSGDQLSENLVDMEYLERGPQGDSERLTKTAASLKGVESENSLAVVQLLGTAVGKQHAWQAPFRESGILQVVVQNLDISNPSAVAKQYLRVIGNCVADNDVNREVVVEELEKVVACLANEDILPTALAVLFNLFNDFEPAHIRAADLRLDNTLASILATDQVPEEAMDYATDLLHSTTEKLTPAQLVDNISLKVFNNILKVSSPYHEDHTQEYLAILVHYIQDADFQQKIATPLTLQRLLDLLLTFSTHLSPQETRTVFHELATQTDPNKVASEETNVVLMVRLASSLAAVSASDAFVQNVSLQSHLFEKIVEMLREPVKGPATVCACVMLGNLATSDRVCIDMVDATVGMALHNPLIDILSNSKETALLYAAEGFMRHLAFPEPNRSILGESGLISTCCHLLTLEDPSVRGEAAAILCKLVSNCLPNIEKVLNEAIPAGITPVQLPDTDTEVPTNPTILYHIVSQALAPSAPLPSTTMKNPMIELGRTIITILRYLRTTPPNPSSSPTTLTDKFFQTPLIARPIARLVRQRFYADARSEGLLGLGLMAQSREGAVCVVQEMEHDGGLLEAIKEFAVEQKGEGQASDDKAGRDWQNAVVLLHGVAENGAGAMNAALKSSVESLQTELSRLMV